MKLRALKPICSGLLILSTVLITACNEPEKKPTEETPKVAETEVTKTEAVKEPCAADDCGCSNLPKRFPVAALKTDSKAVTKEKAPTSSTKQKGQPDGPVPPGMTWIPGGAFAMGCETAPGRGDEKPIHKVTLSGYWMGITTVTNADFRKFVAATKYVTTAEVAPKMEDIMAQMPKGSPEPPKEVLIAASLVFTPPVERLNADYHWKWIGGASWKAPQGPGTDNKGKDNHPVVQISWFDAEAYCKWAGGRLPTEAEFEFASRGGLKDELYVNKHFPYDPNKKPGCNVWEGKEFPYRNTVRDGYMRTSPVKNYPANGYGLYDMAGNVWEWTNDWYRPETYQERSNQKVVNPTGPEKDQSYDPNDGFKMAKKVTRGGSFLCTINICQGYRPAARMKSTQDSSTDHTGFRLVMTQEQWLKKQSATK